MKLCNKKMTFEECELAILRASVDKAEKIKIPPPEIEARKMQDTETEAFLRKNVVYLLAIISSTIIIYTLVYPTGASRW